ncbi:MAG: hypothetical protein ABIJ33_05050 [Patescibacteria group bacterium]
MDMPAQSSGRSALLSRFMKQASLGSVSLIKPSQSSLSQLPNLPSNKSTNLPDQTGIASIPVQSSKSNSDIDQTLVDQLSVNLSTSPLQPVQIPDAVKLDILDQVISEVETSPTDSQSVISQLSEPSVLDSVMPEATLQATDTLNPQSAPTTAKEKVEAQSVVETPVDLGSSTQVELEKTPELPIEVEQYLTHVEDNANQLPQQIVVTGDDIAIEPSHRPTSPVIVLPITPEDEKEARFKGPSWSIRWLVEWSHKIIKKFVGKVVYRRIGPEQPE